LSEVPCSKGWIINHVRHSGDETPTRVRWGGAAATMAGLAYGAAGYLDKPGMSGYASALVSVLSVVVPVLLLGGLLGLRCQLLLEGGRSFARGAGFVLGCLGAVLGVITALSSARIFFGLTSLVHWWWVPLFAGLTLMGLATLLSKVQRRLGALVLVSGMLGWVSLLTDADFSGALMPVRPVHVAFAVAFCLSCVLWGGMLFVGTHRPQRSKS
jgi:hypothetical protein